jgi:hypothetical protein
VAARILQRIVGLYERPSVLREEQRADTIGTALFRDLRFPYQREARAFIERKDVR